jgi:hypothetical protein
MHTQTLFPHETKILLGFHLGNGSTRVRDSRGLTSALVRGVVVFVPLFDLGGRVSDKVRRR